MTAYKVWVLRLSVDAHAAKSPDAAAGETLEAETAEQIAWLRAAYETVNKG